MAARIHHCILIILSTNILATIETIPDEPPPYLNRISDTDTRRPQIQYFQFMRNTYGRQNLSEVAEEFGIRSFEQNFTEFQRQFQKHYVDGEELESRRSNFLYSLKLVKENQNDFKTGRVPYRLAINKMADFGVNEKVFINQKLIRARHEAANKPLPFDQKSTFNAIPAKRPNETSVTFPTLFDWRSRNMVTPVEDQGDCGSSWIFSGVSVVESSNAIAGNPLVVLSKQQVLDCVGPPFYLSDGCNGGLVSDVFQYAKQVGVAMEKSYPYTGKQGKCQNVVGEWREWIYRYNYLPLNSSDEVLMWVIYNKGPVSALVNAGDKQFQLYSGGVLTSGGGDCGLDSEYNQYVSIVGWGTDNGLDFWVVKNSWGRDWGEGGYVKMIRGVNNRGLNTVVAYAEALPIRQPEPPKPPRPEPNSGGQRPLNYSSSWLLLLAFVNLPLLLPLFSFSLFCF